MKKTIIYFIIAICIIGCCFLLWYFSSYLFEKDLKQNENEYMTTEQSNGNNLNTQPSNVEQMNIEAGKDERVMLADMLKDEKDIVFTEDNVDNSNKIIEKANLKNGIFIVESSRKKFLEIINTATENTYSINNEGYLMKPSNESKTSDLTQKINNYIDSKNLIIINISSTYKGMLNDGIMLDFMIERTMYIQTFKYNDNIKIALVNPDRINEKSEDLTQKEIYEEVLLGL